MTASRLKIDLFRKYIQCFNRFVETRNPFGRTGQIAEENHFEFEFIKFTIYLLLPEASTGISSQFSTVI